MILYSYEDMILRLGENKKKNGDILGGGEQLNELEDNISNASSFDKTQSKNPMSPKSPMEKEKKSIWRWETFKSLTKIGSKKFNCCFTLQVHGVEGLPPFFDNMRISVHWKTKDEEFSTRPSIVIDGVADFDDYLIHSCSIYGSSSGANRSAKYGSKHFLLYISVYDNGDLDLGKHRIDLTRILPLTLEELEEKKSGNWTTSFKLSGLAKGATMKVSFGYMLVANSPCSKSSVASVRNASHSRQNSEIASMNLSNHGRSSDEINLRRVRSNPIRSSLSGISMDDIKDLHEILPASTSEYSESNNSSLDNNLGIDGNAKSKKPSRLASFILSDDKDGYELDDFSIIDKGVEIDHTNGTSSKKELMKDLELALDCASNLAKSRADFQEDECMNEKDHLEVMSNDKESEPESPREQLLREFEEGDLDHFCSLIDYDMESEGEESNDGVSFTSAWKTIYGEYNHRYSFSGVDRRATLEMHPIKSISSVSQLEGLETEALMSEWGVNEKDSQNSPRRSIRGIGSTTDLPPESNHYELPQLGEGSSIPTKNGGFMRSMNPSLFRNAKTGGNLIMQVSNPVVVPAEMGPGVMDILQHLASIGIEKLSVQANKLMPLEDITGKTMQQVAYEGSVGLLQQANELENSTSREGKEETEWSDKTNSSSNQRTSIEQITLENLAPLAMEKIEALFLEGLRIQSSMSDDYASKDIIARTTSGFSPLQGNKANVDDRVDLEGISGLQLLDVKNNVHDDDDDDDGGLMGLSLPLNEWMKLDAGNFDDEENISERTYRILAAHHAKSSSNARSHGEGRKGGLLRNNFTIALMVQLRDPLRNLESVGTPMLSLIQIERVFSPFTQSILNINYEVNNTNEDEEMKGQTSGDEEENVTKYTIYKVYVAGFVSDPTKKKLWGSPSQQRSGSRWLLANGMGKAKHPLMKTKFVSNLRSLKTNNVQPSDTLWSISSGIRGCGDKWKGHDVMNPHTRNPNIRTLRLW
ncbi:hypothetical protein Leryth_010278 [Lithospermum erythrorhizon]|nr:hypothetical protein Leryth_010278 [Lithospermum erythrorhizon]